MTLLGWDLWAQIQFLIKQLETLVNKPTSFPFIFCTAQWASDLHYSFISETFLLSFSVLATLLPRRRRPPAVRSHVIACSAMTPSKLRQCSVAQSSPSHACLVLLRAPTTMPTLTHSPGTHAPYPSHGKPYSSCTHTVSIINFLKINKKYQILAGYESGLISRELGSHVPLDKPNLTKEKLTPI